MNFIIVDSPTNGINARSSHVWIPHVVGSVNTITNTNVVGSGSSSSSVYTIYINDSGVWKELPATTKEPQPVPPETPEQAYDRAMRVIR